MFGRWELDLEITTLPAMRPLLRHVSRSVVDSIIAPVPSTSRLCALKIRSTHGVRPSICIECRLRGHARPYSDNNKPSPYAVPKNDGSMNTLDPLLQSSSNGTRHAPPQNLPSHEEERRSRVSKHLSHVMDNLQSNIFIAGKRLNDLTGYSGIEAMKKEIEEQGTHPRTPLSLPAISHNN